MVEQDRKAALEQALATHETMGPEEEAHLAQMQAFLEAVADPFDRAEEAGHFTASALVVSPGLDQVLLMHHRRLDKWLQCGGHLEPSDGTPFAGALREAREETGLEALVAHPLWSGLLDVDVHHIPADAKMTAHDHLDLRYLLVADPAAPLARAEDEAKDLRWCAWDEAEALVADAGLRRLFQKVHRIRTVVVMARDRQ